MNSFSLLLDTLQKKCSINFEEKIIETDQGTVLNIHDKSSQNDSFIMRKVLSEKYSIKYLFFQCERVKKCSTELEFELTSKRIMNSCFIKQLEINIIVVHIN